MRIRRKWGERHLARDGSSVELGSPLPTSRAVWGSPPDTGLAWALQSSSPHSFLPLSSAHEAASVLVAECGATLSPSDKYSQPAVRPSSVTSWGMRGLPTVSLTGSKNSMSIF